MLAVEKTTGSALVAELFKEFGKDTFVVQELSLIHI